MKNLLKDAIHAEVTAVSRDSKYLNGYGSPATVVTSVLISGGSVSNGASLRTVTVSIPADLPIGTRFLVTVEQIDEVTPATIHRGAFPVIEDKKLIEGTV